MRKPHAVLGAAAVAVATLVVLAVALAQADGLVRVPYPPMIRDYLEPCPDGSDQYALLNPATGKYRELRCP